MGTNSVYEEWIGWHTSSRNGERRRRVAEGHGHAERLFAESVWWPAFHHFSNLHPEYEVVDFRDGVRFLDFAYIHGQIRVCIEIDGFGPHRRDIDRKQFSDELSRQNQLVIDGWQIIRFSYDDVKEKPRRCQQTLQQLFGRLFGNAESGEGNLSVLEKEALRYVSRNQGVARPGDLFRYLGVGRKRGNALVQSLIEKKWFQSRGSTQRVRAYRLKEDRSVTF
ncbi:DNA-binding response regulator [Paenibacillus hodogayensis]|uniref:DNA-binding response regulator n=1 Tax=Paenibacillus hodogayensis TaxID=279208 RepID=A0ABV5W531_9BACL